MFQRFLIAKLLEDYTNEPYTITKWILDKARRVEDGSDLDTTYQVHVIYPLEEMILDRDHVENKLRAAAIRQGRSGGDIQPLIDKRDWSNLVTALTNDRDLTLKLFEGPPFGTDLFDSNTRERILGGIDEIKEKYSTELSAPQTSDHTNHRSPSTPLTMTPPNTRHRSEDRSVGNGFAWNIYSTIASSLWAKPGPKSRAYSDANWDEAASLINLKKAK